MSVFKLQMNRYNRKKFEVIKANTYLLTKPVHPATVASAAVASPVVYVDVDPGRRGADGCLSRSRASVEVH